MSQTPLMVDSRPQLALDGRRAKRLEADLIRLETHADANGLARLEAVCRTQCVRPRPPWVQCANVRPPRPGCV